MNSKEQSPFKLFWSNIETFDKHELSGLASWNHQQRIIDEKDKTINELRANIHKLEDERWNWKNKVEDYDKLFLQCQEAVSSHFNHVTSTGITDFKNVILALIEKIKKAEAEILTIGIVFNHLPKEEFVVKYEGSYVFVQQWNTFKEYLEKARQAPVIKTTLEKMQAFRELSGCVREYTRNFQYSSDENLKKLAHKLQDERFQKPVISYNDGNTK